MKKARGQEAEREKRKNDEKENEKGNDGNQRGLVSTVNCAAC
jgi:hypothetical protein